MTNYHEEIKDQKQVLSLYSHEEGDGEIECDESDLLFDGGLNMTKCCMW